MATRAAIGIMLAGVLGGCPKRQTTDRPVAQPSADATHGNRGRKPTARSSAPGLGFCVQEGASENCLLSEGTTAAHVVATSGERGRLVVAFPAANSGAAIWFRAPEGERVSLRISGPPRRVTSGIRFQLQTRTPLTVEKVLLGSVRTIRSYHQRREMSFYHRPVDRAARLLERYERLRIAAKTLGLTAKALRARARTALRVEQPAGPMTLAARTVGLDGRQPMELRLSSTGAHWRQDRRELAGVAFPLTLDLSVVSGHLKRSAPTLPVEEILRPRALALLRRLGHGAGSKTFRSLEFLSSRRRYLAGSWRFLTYFGRDTLMTMWLMLPVLRLDAAEVGLRSVLERLSPDGRVAHEESLGDQATLERLERFSARVERGELDEAERELRRLGEPVYDYKMVDDDFMLPCVLVAYLDQQRVSTQRARRLLGRGANLQAVARNVAHVVKAARSRDVLVGLLKGTPTGDWRDSLEGLGGGRYPASVNVYLVPAALGAVERLLAHPKVNRTGLWRAIRSGGLGGRQPDPSDLLQELGRLRRRWSKGAARFRIVLGSDELRRRLQRFLRSGVARPERRLLRAVQVGDGLTVADLLAGKTPRALSNGLTFDALALDARRRPVEVMHSDDGFALLAMDLDVTSLEPLLVKYELSYPVGLGDAYGVYVANPAFSRRRSDYATFDRGHYHGTVIWSWQVGMLQLGLVRQYRRLRRIDSSQAKTMAARLRALLIKLERARRRVGALRDTELWSVQPAVDGFRPVAYGHGAGQTTESNVLQLWSVVHLAVDHAYARLKLELD